MKKIIITIGIIILVSAIIIKRSYFNIEDNIHIVSQSETNNKEKIEPLPKNTNDKETNINNIINTKNDSAEKDKVTVYISGEVKNPGVVTVEGDKRLSDAVENLGGLTGEADLNGINLAIKLNDEKHYIIPKIGESNQTQNIEVMDINQINESQINNQINKININSASVEELDKLPGVGESTANKIIKHREEIGIFKSVEEIKNVNGIGDKKYLDIKELICVN